MRSHQRLPDDTLRNHRERISRRPQHHAGVPQHGGIGRRPSVSCAAPRPFPRPGGAEPGPADIHRRPGPHPNIPRSASASAHRRKRGDDPADRPDLRRLLDPSQDSRRRRRFQTAPGSQDRVKTPGSRCGGPSVAAGRRRRQEGDAKPPHGGAPSRPAAARGSRASRSRARRCQARRSPPPGRRVALRRTDPPCRPPRRRLRGADARVLRRLDDRSVRAVLGDDVCGLHAHPCAFDLDRPPALG